MTVLSNAQIVEARRRGDIVIEPFVPENMRPNSVDVTLGEWFYRADAHPGGVYNRYSRAEVERYFAGPFQAKPYFNVWRKMREIERNRGIVAGTGITRAWPLPAEEFTGPSGGEVTGPGLVNIPPEHPVIMLLPRERILAHTHEFIGPVRGSVPEMRARSSLGRDGISACLCAGWGDTGYFNRWTMEIINLNDEAVPLPIGERVAQIIFHATGELAHGGYGAERNYESKYQDSGDVAAVISQWTPEAMLPRAWRDKRVLPAPVRPPLPTE